LRDTGAVWSPPTDAAPSRLPTWDGISNEKYAMTTKRRGRGKSAASLALIQAAHDIAERNNPLTIRGICYKLFSLFGLIPDMSTKSTRRVSEQLTDARKPGQNICGWWYDWRWIVDENREAERLAQWDSPDERIRQAIQTYRRDNWQEQPLDIELWSEKGTVRGVCGPVIEEFGITFRVLHGFSSYTAVREVIEERRYADKPLIVLYVGGHDPSGRHMSDVDLPAPLTEYADGDDIKIELFRIALTEDDFLNHNGTEKLPGFPASDKAKDPRYPWFVKTHGHRCWELDAMDENDLRAQVREAITERIDMSKWEHARMIEDREVESMQEYVAATRAVARHFRRRHRHPRPAAAPQPCDHDPRRELPAAREAPCRAARPRRRPGLTLQDENQANPGGQFFVSPGGQFLVSLDRGIRQGVGVTGGRLPSL